jgi:hypothetical protein
MFNVVAAQAQKLPSPAVTAWSNLPLVLSSPSCKESRRDIIPSLSTSLDPDLARRLFPAPALPPQLRSPSLPRIAEFFSLLLRPISDRLQDAEPTLVTQPRNPQSSSTGTRRFRRIRPPAGEAVRLNRPIGPEFGCSGCAQSGGLRI